MTTLPTDHAGMQTLTFAECLDLLASVPVGRIAFVHAGDVVVLPVNHRVDGQDVVFETVSGSTFSAVSERAPISFEADWFDARTRHGWSVLVIGDAEAVLDDDDIQRLRASGLDPWLPTDNGHLVRIRPLSVTGRRLNTARPS